MGMGGEDSKSYPWEVHTALWVACPLAGVEACQGAEALVLDLIPVEQGAEAPCQEEQAVAWASEAFLHKERKNAHAISTEKSAN